MKLATTALAASLLLAACTQSQPAPNQLAADPADISTPAGEPVLERPTLRSLGAYWIIKGDQNKNAIVSLHYRKSNALIKSWVEGPDLFRVAKGANDKGAPSERHENTKLPIPEGSTLYAGSALLLDPNTPYELKLTLHDPDGGDTVRTLQSHTIAEPVAPKNLRTFHVVPGDGGGTGTQADPFKGLKAADSSAQPGSLFLLHAGTYAPILITRSGEPGKPIIYRAAGDGEPNIHGNGWEQTQRAIDVTDKHDIWFEKLTITNANNALVGHESSRLVIRRCKITGCQYGINACVNLKDQLQDFWISDNTILGPSVWPRAKGIEEARGIQVSGAGHDVCYNFVTGFADAIDTYQGARCEAIDFHNNDCELLTDDGMEMDYSERNTRCYHNRITNAFQGISTQPLFGGPVYIFENVVYNIEVEPFKIHNSPSGAIIFSNTLVKKGIPELVLTPAGMYNYIVKNNLFVGTEGAYALELDLGKIENADWDYNGYAGNPGSPFKTFMRWQSPDKKNPDRVSDYKTLDDVKKSGPAERHAILLDNSALFASGAKPPENQKVEQKTQDLRLARNSRAVNAGTSIKGLTSHRGKNPDLGAYELNHPLPHYGPRQ